jgi:hypothetical protein
MWLKSEAKSSSSCVPDDPTFYQSPFTFDADREGPFLAEVFASL